MNFIFYDTETTGTNLKYDQIVQFAAVLVDESFHELERLDVRCQILPWVVPSPAALHVTQIAPGKLEDPALPSHYEMVHTIQTTLSRWSPAKFIGYNSIAFDEELLRRALWQTLHWPWLTTSAGNSRLDLLPLTQIASYLADGVLNIPLDAEKRRRFKLDELAPLNGFVTDQAHDALSDTLATVHIARILASKQPILWDRAVKRAGKSDLKEMVAQRKPLLAFDFRRNVAGYYGQLLHEFSASSSILFARLDAPWQNVANLTGEPLQSFLGLADRPVRLLSLSRSPLLFTEQEANTNWGFSASVAAQRNSQFLAAHPEIATRVAETWQQLHPRRSETDHLEDTMYAGFSSREDQQAAAKFYLYDWSSRVSAVRSFHDQRHRQWAQRLVYAGAPESLEAADKARLDLAIAQRIIANTSEGDGWRNLAAARAELAALPPDDLTDQIKKYLDTVEARWAKYLAPPSSQS